MTTVLISTSSFGRVSEEPLDSLRTAGLEVRLNPHGRTLTLEETRALLPGMSGVVAGTERLDRETLSAASDLRVISRVGSGLENVDLEAARDLGIAVATTPEPPAQAVAELTLGGLLGLLRGVTGSDRDVRAGLWEKPMGSLLTKKTVGIVGTGRAGRALVELLAPFECSLLAFDTAPDAHWARESGTKYVALDELMAQSDIVSLHVPLNDETRLILDRRRLGLMKAGAFLANCARGGLVDEDALADNLKAGWLAGAYLDVFAEEPYSGALIDLPNTILTPHIGSYAAECRLEMEKQAVENLLRELEPRKEQA